MCIKKWLAYDKAMREVWKVGKEERVNGTLKDKIEKAIAMSTIATQLEVRLAYDRLGSWDDVMAAAEKTLEGWSLSCCVDEILNDRASDEVYDKLFKASTSGAKAGQSLRRVARMLELFALMEDESLLDSD